MPEPPVAAPDHAFRVVLVALDYCSDHHCGSEEEREILVAADAALEVLAGRAAALLAERQQDKQRIERLEKALEEADEVLSGAPAMAVPRLVESFKRQVLRARKIIGAALADEEDAE